MTENKPTESYKDAYVPINLWGRDHWSTMGYLDTVIVNKGYTQMRLDPRMRAGRRNYRVLWEASRSLPQDWQYGFSNAVVMDNKYGSRLNDGTYAVGHDDWHCVQDFANEGLLTVDVGALEPEVKFTWSEKGQQVVNQLLNHKRGGGSFSDFVLQVEPSL